MNSTLRRWFLSIHRFSYLFCNVEPIFVIVPNTLKSAVEIGLSGVLAGPGLLNRLVHYLRHILPFLIVFSSIPSGISGSSGITGRAASFVKFICLNAHLYF